MPRRAHSIEADTAILPWVVAETVVNDAQASATMNLPNHLAAEDYLVQKAEQIYKNNDDFRKKIQSEANGGNAGRDHLYVFMEHWLASWTKKYASKFYKALPHGYGWSYSPSIDRLQKRGY